jgi:prepilin-type N-terminal cleavage/methylation domain-containing protein
MMVYCNTNNNNLSAFTLVEMAIVLAIIGLLAGGVIAGKDMIRAAELRKIPVAIEELRKNMNVFYDKYGALPGDFNRATDYWGTDPDGCPTHTVRTPRDATCDGNKDGVIGSSSGPNPPSDRHEYYRFWQHLKNAGLMEGNFTGVAGTGGTTHLVGGENIPFIYGNIALGIYWHGNMFGDAWLIDGNYGNLFVIGRSRNNNENASSALTGEEAYTVDIKIDDGKPNTGNLLGALYPFCSTALDGDSDDFAADYDLSQSTTTCSFYVRNMLPKT